MLTKIVITNLILFLLITPVISDGGWEVTSSGYGGPIIGSHVVSSEYSTNLQIFNKTKGYYITDASQTSYISTGLESHLFTNADNGNIKGGLKFQSADAMLASDSVGMHEDNTNVPESLCDSSDVTLPSDTLTSALNNTSSVSSQLHGIVPMSQDADASYTLMAQGTLDDVASYDSSRSLQGSNIYLSYNTSAPKGNSFQTMSSYIVAGQNRKEEVEQFHQYSRAITVMSSDKNEGMEQHGVLSFTGQTYNGVNMPTTWEQDNTSNETPNETSDVSSIVFNTT
jgi:hypothetical protein